MLCQIIPTLGLWLKPPSEQGTSMTKDEALKLALEALEAAEIDGNCEYGATEIIRKALAQPAQEQEKGI